jgi:hypothetical protein
MNDRLREFVEIHRDSFDDKEPSPMILGRIKSDLKKRSEKRKVLPIVLMKWSVAAVIVSLAGFGLFQLINQRYVPIELSRVDFKVPESPIGQSIVLQDSTHISLRSTGEISDTETILTSSKSSLVRQAFFSKLSNLTSASDRYSAASSVAEIQKIDSDIIGVLVKTMNEDPNSNVRLAALESLSRFSREPLVKKQLIKSLSIQKDPVVQIALIELLTAMRENKIIEELQKITNDETTTQPVKDEAYKSLNNLHS